jgi:hypothetical protein
MARFDGAKSSTALQIPLTQRAFPAPRWPPGAFASLLKKAIAPVRQVAALPDSVPFDTKVRNPTP